MLDSDNKQIQWELNRLPKTEALGCGAYLSWEDAARARRFHASIPGYNQTPLAKLNKLAGKLGLGSLHVKDESHRFGLNAFKALGASYAMGRLIGQKLGLSGDELTFSAITGDAAKAKLGDMTFFSATDGNHGRGVAWTARALGQKAVIYMPKGSAQARIENIRKEGAEVVVTDTNYDDAVRLSRQHAERTPNSLVVQDTAWEGYTDIPTWITQGYCTAISEAFDQLAEMGEKPPTHVFVQAGVGSFAAAAAGFFANACQGSPPVVVVVEPRLTACFFASAAAGDGEPRDVLCGLDTMMVGLACGEPNHMAWEVLKNHCAAFVTVTDSISAKGMRVLGNPLTGDCRVRSGESGAVTTGALYEIMVNDEYRELREALRLDKNSRVLCFSTEGDTEPDNYLDIVWEGRNGKP